MTEVFVIRHGEAESNALGYLTSAVPGPPLTPLGQRQARAVAQILGSRLGRVPAIVTSPIRRALETALPTAEHYGVTPRLEPGLREVGVGAWEGRPGHELKKADPSFLAWRSDPERHRPPGGEAASEVANRMRQSLERAAAEAGEGVLVAFSHQHALASLLALVDGLPWSAVPDLKRELPNAVIAHLRYGGGPAAWQFAALDPAAHHAGRLEAAGDTAGSR